MEANQCAICYDSMKEKEEKIITTFCNHLFHLKCIKIWFTYNNICPLCKRHQSAEQIMEIADEEIKVMKHHQITHQYITITLAMTLREQGGMTLPGWPSMPLREYDERERINSRFGDEFFPEWDHITHIITGREKLWQEKSDRIADMKHRNARIALWKSYNKSLGKYITNKRYEDEDQLRQLEMELKEQEENKIKQEEDFQLNTIKQENWLIKKRQHKMTDEEVKIFIQNELTRIYKDQHERLMIKIRNLTN